MKYDLLITCLAALVAIVQYGLVTGELDTAYASFASILLNLLIGYFTNKK
jgi:hypothetical protein